MYNTNQRLKNKKYLESNSS